LKTTHEFWCGTKIKRWRPGGPLLCQLRASAQIDLNTRRGLIPVSSRRSATPGNGNTRRPSATAAAFGRRAEEQDVPAFPRGQPAAAAFYLARQERRQSRGKSPCLVHGAQPNQVTASGGGVKAAQATGERRGGNRVRASLQAAAPPCECWPRGAKARAKVDWPLVGASA